MNFSPTKISKGREDYKDLSVFIGLALGVIAAVAVVIFLLLGALIKAEVFGDDRNTVNQRVNQPESYGKCWVAPGPEKKPWTYAAFFSGWMEKDT